MSLEKIMLKKMQHAKEKGNKDSTIEIELSKLKQNPYQPRLEIKEEEIEELAASIKEQGLIQPIAVTPATGKTGYYYIIAGHRRVEAHKLLQKEKIKAVVLKEIDDEKLMALSLIENMQRKNLDVIEEAIALKNALLHFKTIEKLSKALGYNNSLIGKKISILKLNRMIIDDIKENKTTSDVVALNMLNKLPNELQYRYYKEFLEKGRGWLKEAVKNFKKQKSEKNPFEFKHNKRSKKLVIKIDKIDAEKAKKIEEFIKQLLN